MEFFTEQAYDLLIEAAGTPLDYVAQQTAKKSNTDDMWTFTTGQQNLGVRANTIKSGKIMSYKKNKNPSIFHVFSLSSDGKTSPHVRRITKPFHVVATISKIIAEQIADNKNQGMILLRVPAVMGEAETIRALAARQIKRLGLSGWTVGSTINVENKNINYVAIGRTGNKTTFVEVFGEGVNVTKIAERPIMKPAETEEEQEQIDQVGQKAEQAVAPRLRTSLPAKVDLTGVAGTADTPEVVQVYMGKNPTIFARIRDKDKIVKPKRVDVNKEIFDKGQLEYLLHKPTPTAMNQEHLLSSIEPHTPSTRTMTPNRQKALDKLESLKLTWADVLEGSKLAEAKQVFLDLARQGELNQQAFNIGGPSAYGEEKSANSKLAAQRAFGWWMAHRFNADYKKLMQFAYSKYSHIEKNPGTIKSYCGKGYMGINDFLLKGNGTKAMEAKVKAMDNSFLLDGVYLTKQDVVYRSMSMPTETMMVALEHKLFHFRTFVSTSLSPFVGYTFRGSGMMSLSSMTDAEIDDLDTFKNYVKVTFDINGLDKCPCLIPGSISPHHAECEVILPRGTTLRINKAAKRYTTESSSESNLVDGMHWKTTVVAPEELAVNEAVYDGDLFVRTGKLELMDFNSFVTESSSRKLKPSKSELLSDEAILMMVEIEIERIMREGTFEEQVELMQMQEKFEQNIG